jgi:hypothetical protein
MKRCDRKNSHEVLALLDEQTSAVVGTAATPAAVLKNPNFSNKTAQQLRQQAEGKNRQLSDKQQTLWFTKVHVELLLRSGLASQPPQV